MMKTISRVLLVCSGLAVLVAGWLYLYIHSNAISSEKQNTMVARLKDLKQLDSDWNVNVLRSQTEINKSYDPLTVPLTRFVDILKTLDDEADTLKDTELKASIETIRETINRKMTLIDRFKAQNALLKNSVRYVPTAYKDIQERMRAERNLGLSQGTRMMQDVPKASDQLGKLYEEANKSNSDSANRKLGQAIERLRSKMNDAKQQADAATRGAASLADLEGSISALVGEALQYNSVPDGQTGDELKANIEKMRSASPLLPPSVREPVDNLLSHLDAILRFRLGQMELLKEISLVPITDAVDGLGGALTRRFDAEYAQQFTYQRLLLAYSAVALLLVFGFTGVIVYRNITEHKRLTALVESQTKELKDNEVLLIHAQKMNALGEMVAGITHEINTPLASLKSGLQSSRDLLDSVGEYFELSGPVVSSAAAGNDSPSTMSEQAGSADEIHQELKSFDAIGIMGSLLNDGIKSVEYIHQVVINMLNFSRLDRSRISAVKIEDCIDSTLAMAKHFLKKLEVVKHLGNTPPVNCDMAQINQVLLNLVKNAAQACPDTGGTLTIETAMQSENELRIAVTDTGSGIPPEVLPKIWEAFFTTKKEGAGTGLGLSTCKKIITSHGGKIEVASMVGKGTTFTILLPITPPSSLYEEHGQEMNSRFVTE